jgi:hypothetical protein
MDVNFPGDFDNLLMSQAKFAITSRFLTIFIVDPFLPPPYPNSVSLLERSELYPADPTFYRLTFE